MPKRLDCARRSLQAVSGLLTAVGKGPPALRAARWRCLPTLQSQDSFRRLRGVAVAELDGVVLPAFETLAPERRALPVLDPLAASTMASKYSRNRLRCRISGINRSPISPSRRRATLRLMYLDDRHHARRPTAPGNFTQKSGSSRTSSASTPPLRHSKAPVCR